MTSKNNQGDNCNKFSLNAQQQTRTASKKKAKNKYLSNVPRESANYDIEDNTVIEDDEVEDQSYLHTSKKKGGRIENI